MDIFTKIYLEGIYKNSSSISKYKVLNPIINGDLQEFYNNAIKIKVALSDLIQEEGSKYTHLENRIYNSYPEDKMSFSEFSLLYYRDTPNENVPISKNCTLNIHFLDFKNPDKIYSIFAKNNLFKIDKNNIELQKSTIINDFKEFSKDSDGLVIPYQNTIFLFIDSSKSKDVKMLTIRHEINHVIQYIFDINTFENPDETKLKDIPSLQLSKETLKYVLSEKEFPVHVKVELDHLLRKVYTKYFRTKISYQNFILNYINNINKNSSRILDSEIGEKIKLENNILPFVILPSCKILGLEKHLKYGLDILYDSIKSDDKFSKA